MPKLAPRRRLPPPNWLRSFEAAARHESFTEAAVELNMTQAAISQHVRLLEHFLQQKLFDRLPRRLVLTDAGKSYLPSVRHAFERLSASTEELFGHDRKRVITVKVEITYAILWLAPRLVSFQEMYPDYQVRVTNSLWVEEVGWENVDLDLRYGLGNWDGMQVERLSNESLFPVCSPELAKKLKKPSDLLDNTLVRVVGNEDSWERWIEGATQEPCSELLQPVQFDSSAVAYEAVASGMGITLAKTNLVQTYLDRGLLVKPFEFELNTGEGFYIVTPQNRRDGPGAKLFRDWVTSVT